MRKTTKKEINRSEIDEAIQNFLAQGGQINVLPAERVIERNHVGADKYAVYESIHDINFV